jgi:hypothetical protein
MNELLNKWAILKQDEAEAADKKAEIVFERLKLDLATDKEVFLNWGMLKSKLEAEDRQLYFKALAKYQDFRDLNC